MQPAAHWSCDRCSAALVTNTSLDSRVHQTRQKYLLGAALSPIISSPKTGGRIATAVGQEKADAAMASEDTSLMSSSTRKKPMPEMSANTILSKCWETPVAPQRAAGLLLVAAVPLASLLLSAVTTVRRELSATWIWMKPSSSLPKMVTPPGI